MYTIELLTDISETIINEAIEMDHATFPFEDWISEEDAALIYSTKKNCLIWLTQDGKPAGFATIFPLNETLPAKAIKKEKPIYKLLTEHALRDQNTGILYCHCFSILPKHRNKGLIYKLYEGLYSWLQKNGASYTLLYADAVSSDGCRCLDRLGFHSICSFGKEGTLYKTDKRSVMDKIKHMAEK